MLEGLDLFLVGLLVAGLLQPRVGAGLGYLAAVADGLFEQALLDGMLLDVLLDGAGRLLGGRFSSSTLACSSGK